MARGIPILLVAGGLAIAGCASSTSATTVASTTSRASTTTGASTAEPAGALPSAQAKMVCSKEAQDDIAASLGVTAARVSTPTWVDHVYACDYVYRGGMITLSVTELVDEAHTTAVYKAFAARLGKRPTIAPYGEGAFVTTNGSVIVRKDFKVLEIDISLLPPTFGRPLRDRSDVALDIAATVMACWPGS